MGIEGGNTVQCWYVKTEEVIYHTGLPLKSGDKVEKVTDLYLKCSACETIGILSSKMCKLIITLI